MTVTPAQPVTEAQRARYQRMVEVATMLVTTGGEDALQMSEMPALAEVSLATLYRYFPSKEHLLFAVVHQHLEQLKLADSSDPGPGGWVGLPRGRSVGISRSSCSSVVTVISSPWCSIVRGSPKRNW